MAKTIQFKPKTYSDVAYVEGVAHRDTLMERELERHCHSYFNEYSRGIFFCDDDTLLDIYQEAFITLWQKIEMHKIYVEDGVLKNVNGKPFTSSLLTYFMSIAKLKNLEISRDKLFCIELEEEIKHTKKRFENIDFDPCSMLYEEPSNIMCDIIAECISVMSERCNQILTKFYYEEKSLDDILMEVPSFSSKNALKTHKYKCMETLRKNAQDWYRRYIND